MRKNSKETWVGGAETDTGCKGMDALAIRIAARRHNMFEPLTGALPARKSTFDTLQNSTDTSSADISLKFEL